MFVKPAPGRLVRDPFSKVPLPAEGRDVPEDGGYWSRRLRDGDIMVAAPAASAAPEPAEAHEAAEPSEPTA